MKSTNALKISWLVSSLLAFAVAMPAVADTEDEIKALKGEIEVLQQGQESMREDLAAIRRLLEQGARAAPAAAPGFAPKDLVVGESAIMGDEDAPVTMFAYSDYQCPFCRRHATTVMNDIVNEYIDKGKLRVVMREFPIESIHPRAFAASQAAVCAGAQGKYWEMHDLIFSDQKALTDADLNGHAQTLGVDQAAFEACLADKKVSDGIRADIREAQGMGISGTPSFVVGLTNPEDLDKVRVTRYIRGAQPFPSFMNAIEDQLKEVAAE